MSDHMHDTTSGYRNLTARTLELLSQQIADVANLLRTSDRSICEEGLRQAGNHALALSGVLDRVQGTLAPESDDFGETPADQIIDQDAVIGESEASRVRQFVRRAS